MQKSLFQFSNPILKELKFELNDQFNKEEANFDTKFQVKITRDDNEPRAIVEVTATVGNTDDDSCPYCIVVKEGAIFKWNKEDLTVDKVDSLLKKNAPMLLIGYIRAIASVATSFSGMPSYDLPFINFTAEEGK